jgi:glycosyltransferase involved in cell wall biosynthesis
MASEITNQPLTRKPLRILVVTGIYPTEQCPHAGTFIKSQVDSLVAAGLEVEVIHPRPGPVLLRYASAALQVFFKTLTGSFDIVHGHYGQWCLIARMQWTTPVVASFLGDDLQGTYLANGRWSKKAAIIVQLSRWLIHHVDAAIVKSEQMKQIAVRGRNSSCEERIFVIPNGVDFSLFRPMPRAEARHALGWDQEHYYILFGNNPKVPVKNFPLAQAAVDRLHARGIAAELVVATGLPQAKLVQYINASNVLILSSVAEGSPNIVKEAMACNVPVVCTNVGDVSHVVGRTKGCRVCPPDPGALAAALEEVLQHPEPTTGRTDIMHLDRAVVAKRVIAVYEQVSSKKKKGKILSSSRRQGTIYGNAP